MSATTSRPAAATPGQLIRHYRELRGLNQSELARRLGLRPQSVQEWEAHTTAPSAKRIPEIAAALGVEPRDLAHGAPLLVEITDDRKNLRVNVGVRDEADTLQAYPVAGGAAITIRSLGEPAGKETPVSMIVVSPAWAMKHFPGHDPHALRVESIHGDAMAPTLVEGDLVIIDVSRVSIDIDRLWALRSPKGSIAIKRAQRRLDGSLLLLSDNERYHPEVVVPGDEVRLDVVGQVCGRAAVSSM